MAIGFIETYAQSNIQNEPPAHAAAVSVPSVPVLCIQAAASTNPANSPFPAAVLAAPGGPTVPAGAAPPGYMSLSKVAEIIAAVTKLYADAYTASMTTRCEETAGSGNENEADDKDTGDDNNDAENFEEVSDARTGNDPRTAEDCAECEQCLLCRMAAQMMKKPQ